MTVSEYPDVPATGDGESRRVDLDDLVSAFEIASEYHITRAAVYTWANSAESDFPKPVIRFGALRVWLRSQVHEWHLARRDRLRSPRSLGGPRHGTSRYRSGGCRCEVCRAANTEYSREERYRRAKRLGDDPTLAPHGSANTYNNWGCRCNDCTRAKYPSVASRTDRGGR